MMKTIDIANIVRTTRTRSTGLMLAVSLSFTGALGVPLAASAPAVDDARVTALREQNVDYLSTDQAIMLGTSGVNVLVPSWLPGPVSGSYAEALAGDGYYSVYWFGGGGAHLMVEAVAGGGFPGGSEANLNVQLFVNTTVQGWPAIHDIGIPEGSETPIYDKVMWIASGVLYTVTGNNLGTDSVSLANSLISLEIPAQVPEVPPTEVPYVPPTEVPYVPPTEAPYVPPTEVPYVPPTEVPYVEPTEAPSVPVTDVPYIPATEAPYVEPSNGATDTTTETPTGGDANVVEPAADNPLTNGTTSDTSANPNSTVATEPSAQPTDGTDVPVEAEPTALPIGDGTGGGAWSPSMLDQDIPSDGTAGPRPPVVGSDGTGGRFDSTVPSVYPGRTSRP